mgnify:FL=1
MDAEAWSLKARWVIPMTAPPVENGVVEVVGDRITRVGRGGAPTVDLGEVILLPGLVNAHTHLDLTGFPRPVSPPATFANWIRTVIRHRLAESSEQRVASVREGIRQSLEHGVSLVGDISTDGSSARLLRGTSLRGTVYHEILGLNESRAEQTRLAAMEWLQNEDSGGGVVRGLSPHAPYSTKETLFRWSKGQPVPTQIHLAETSEEMEILESGNGPLVDMLLELGLWPPAELLLQADEILDLMGEGSSGSPLGLVHVNHLPVVMAGKLKSGTTLIHCPRTHAWFEREPFPMEEWMKAGIRIALGTDGEACAPDLDILAEARALFAGRPGLAPASILAMCTVNGAHVLGWEGRQGALAKNYIANAVAYPAAGLATSGCPIEHILGTEVRPCRILRSGFLI